MNKTNFCELLGHLEYLARRRGELESRADNLRDRECRLRSEARAWWRPIASREAMIGLIDTEKKLRDQEKLLEMNADDREKHRGYLADLYAAAVEKGAGK